MNMTTLPIDIYRYIFLYCNIHEIYNFSKAIKYMKLCKEKYLRDFKENALIESIKNIHVDIVKILLECQKIDVNFQNKHDTTALFISIYTPYKNYNKRRNDIISLLLKSDKLDINLKNFWGNTAFIKACRYNNIEVIELLLQHPKIDINVQNNLGNTAYITCCKFGYVNIIKKLHKFKNLNIHLQNLYGKTAFMTSIYNYKTIKELLKHEDIDVNILSTNNITTLMIVINSSVDIVNLLLQCPKIDINLQDWNGNTALMYCCKQMNIERVDIIKKILQHPKIDINLYNKCGQTALMMAFANGRRETMELIYNKMNY